MGCGITSSWAFTSDEVSKINMVMGMPAFDRLKPGVYVCAPCARRLPPVFPGDFNDRIIFLTFIAPALQARRIVIYLKHRREAFL